MATVTTIEQIQLRTATAEEWGRDNPTLLLGEQGWDSTSRKMKVGDGFTKWTALGYQEDVLPTGGGTGGGSSTVGTVAGTKAATRTMLSSTLTADPDLRVAASAGTTYSLYARLHYTASAAGGIKIGLSLPSGRIDGIARGATLVPVHITGTSALDGNVGTFPGAGAVEQIVEIRATVTIGGSAGSIGIVAGQNTTDSTGTVLLANSRLELAPSVPGAYASTDPTTVGGATAPGVTTIATETFTSSGSAGTPWPSQWTAAAGPTQTVTTSSLGQLLPAGTGYVNAREVLTGSGAITDSESYSEHRISATTEHYIVVSVRTKNEGAYNPSGYYLMLRPGNADGGFEVGVGNGAAASTKQDYGALTYAAGHTYGVRISAVGSTIRFKVWDLAGAEPGDYMLTVTDSTYASGFYAVGQQSGSATNPASLVDNVKITTPTVNPYATTPNAGTTMPTTTSVTSSGHTWTKSYAQDFLTAAALGQMPTVYSSMAYYTEETPDTNGAGRYSATKTASVANSVLHVDQKIIGGTPYGAVILPEAYTPHTYGRVEVRYRQKDVAGVGGFKFVGLWWPISDNWADGEIDYPESDQLGTAVRAANASANPAIYDANGNRKFFPSPLVSAPTDSTDWHVAAIDWTPDGIFVYHDGKYVNRITEGLPTKPMRWGLQMETWLPQGRAIPANAAGWTEVDWLVIYNMTA